MKLAAATQSIRAHQTFSFVESRVLFERILRGEAPPAELGEFLRVLSERGETSEEIAGAAAALRAAMLPFEHAHGGALDTAGTGGDGLGLFNLSTAAALVAAAAGAKVIKHGNRAASSRCGSADLLEAAGLPLDLAPEGARATLDEFGIAFLFAPRYHPALAELAPLRRALGIRTVFNLLGPLANPGGVTIQLLGVPRAGLLETMAEVLIDLDVVRAYVVHGAGGADELTLAGKNDLCAVNENLPMCFDARELGLAEAPLDALAGGDAATNLRLLRGVLAGQRSPLTDAVLLNASAALVLSGAKSAAEGLARAREALDSGAAQRTFDGWIALARSLARGP